MCSSLVLSFYRIVQAVRLPRFFVHIVFIQSSDEIKVSPACSCIALISAHEMRLLVSVRYDLLFDPSRLFWCACSRIAPMKQNIYSSLGNVITGKLVQKVVTLQVTPKDSQLSKLLAWVNLVAKNIWLYATYSAMMSLFSWSSVISLALSYSSSTIAT